MQINRFSPTLTPQRAASSSSPTSSNRKLTDAVDNLTVSALTLGTNVLDATMALGYATKGFPQAFQAAGYAVGVAHAATGLGYFISCVDKGKDTYRHRGAYAVGHALSALGHIAGAAGAGVWSVAPLVGGMLVTTLEDYRSRTS